MRNAPGSELRRAVEEFNNPLTDPARKDRLLSYVAATGDSFLALKETTLAELGRATALASKLGEIVKHQDKFIYSSSSMEPIPVRDVLRDALDLLPPRLASSIGIDIDSAIDGLPPVTAERIALMQVFHNLLLNAVEAIQAAERADGRIKVTAARPQATPGMIDVQVRDNGTGIDTGNLARIFERGYTTKQHRVGGLGLHWCANTVINMRGRLHAESGGSGHGATFHLLLPAATQAMAAE
jgi:signal transduction histidine kinase